MVVIANVNETDLIGCTQLNGYGCVCHTVEIDTTVSVWVEGPESLYVGQTGLYKMFMAGGPAEAGGYNVAGRFGEMVLVDTFSFQHQLAMNELTQAFSLPFPTSQDTIYWEFGYKTLESSADWDTIYSCGLSLVWDSIPDFRDRWNFGQKFPIEVIDGQIPVELSNFNAIVNKDFVTLNWTTITELNNYGFEIFRSFDVTSWQKIGFVSGYSTSTEKHFYSFIDYQNNETKGYYKLKQIDHNGSYTFSEIIEVQQQTTPSDFVLYQNYPNPFNPSTIIKFTVPPVIASEAKQSQMITLKVYDVLGNEVVSLVNEQKAPGDYEVEFSAKGGSASGGNAYSLPSGIYFYKLEAGGFSVTKKMLLLR
jgi:hypothetical protein